MRGDTARSTRSTPTTSIDCSSSGRGRSARKGVPSRIHWVYDGVLYIASPGGIVEALDAATGELRWRYRHQHEMENWEEVVTGRAATRSIAIYDDKIYLATFDGHVVALHAPTGEMVWNVKGADYRLGYRYTTGPLIVQGRAVVSTNGCEMFYEAKDDPCFISAFDADTGEELWRTSTVAKPGEAGWRHLGRHTAVVPDRWG